MLCSSLILYLPHAFSRFMSAFLCPDSIIHTDLKPENVLLDLPPRPPPESDQPPPLPGKLPKGGVQGVATTIDDLSAALAMADAHGLTAEEKRKLKKKVRRVLLKSCGAYKLETP